MKVMVNVEKRHAFAIMGLLVLGIGIFVVNALASGIDISRGYHESNQISVNVSGTEKTLQEAIDEGGFGGVPSGAVMAFDLSSCPSGWTELTTARGKVIVGLNTADSNFDVLGEIGGEKTHTLTVAEMPAHTHTESGERTFGSVVFYETSNYYGAMFRQRATGSTGGGVAHNNLQPYITFIYCEKN